MKADFRVCLDACVLANYGVCDLFLRLSKTPRLIVPCWSETILEEVHRTHREKLGWPEHIAASFQQKLRTAFPEAIVHGFEGLIPGLTNHEKDRHVLASAIRGNCFLIITFNLRDFPVDALQPWDVYASHPQDYLLTLYEIDPKRVVACLGEIAGRKKIEVEDVLIGLGRSVPKFSSRLLDDLSS